jgi:uncharacterized protein YbjT (DUF2867 family)
MRILVLGAYGLIGARVTRHLEAAGHDVIGLGRDTRKASISMPDVAWIAADIAHLTSRERWAPILTRAAPEAIVNCAGVLQDGARDDVAAVQHLAQVALYEAAAAFGVRQLVQISATRASAEADTQFMRTKGRADDVLRASGLDWTILRPGLVLAPQAYGGTALLRALAAFPFVQPLAYPDRLVQTVHVDDVAAAVSSVLSGQVPTRRDYDLVEEDAHALRVVVARLRAWLGMPQAREITLPQWLVGVTGRIADALGYAGWRSPLRTTAMREIAAGVVGDASAWRAATGARLRSLDASLRDMPATVQERWFARMFLLKPIVIAVLSLFWLVSGLVALANLEAAASVLTTRGVEAPLSRFAVIAGALVDLLLGGLVVIRRFMPAAALGMIATTVAYLAGGTLLAPDLWADPLGPLVKAIPALVLAAVLLAIAEDR